MSAAKWLLAAVALQTICTPARADETLEQKTIYAARPEHDIFKFDFGAPTSPAMTLLGLTPDKSPSSTSLTDFVVSLPSTPEGGGDSLALDFPAARLFLRPSAATLDRYVEDSWLFRLGYRTRFGMAGMTGNDGGSDPASAVPSRLSIGLSTSLLDSSDPLVARKDFMADCLKPKLGKAADILNENKITDDIARLNDRQMRANVVQGSTPIDRSKATELLGLSAGEAAVASEYELRSALRALINKIDAEVAELEAEQLKPIKARLDEAGVTEEVLKCTEDANQFARHQSDLDVGFGALAQGEPGQLEDLEWRGAVIWTAFKQPLRRRVEYKDDDGDGITDYGPAPDSTWFFVASARASWDERLKSGDTVTPEFRADTWDAWIGFERLTPGYRFTAQYGWLETSAREATGKAFEKSGERYLLSGQFRLGGKDSSLWLGVSYGNGYGTSADLKSDTAMVTLGYSPTPLDITGGR